MMKEKPNERKDFSMIGKLMAAENINVRYDYTETAYFDLESRNLVLPIYEGLSRDVYEMMLAHEVSHALNTDQSDWKEYVGADSNKQQYANIVEDARIEKLIRRRYPGVTRHFKSGYKELHEKNFFGLEDGEDLSERVLIDRLNLHFKSYGNLEVPFTAEEAEWVSRISAAETWSDVTEIVDELYAFEKEKQQEQNSEEPEETTSAGDTEDSEGEDTEDSEETEENAEDTEDTTEETTEETENTEGEDDSRNTSDNAENTEDTENTEDAENTNASEGVDDDSDNEADAEDAEAPTAKSMEDFEKKLKDNAKDNTGSYIASVTLRDNELDAKWKELLVPAKDFVSYFREVLSDYGQFNETKIVEQYRELNKANSKTINHMLKEFDMKKAANVAKRTMTSKTGDLDLDKLYNYKTSDDIFLKHESVPDGKNHGVVMLIDFSGSMSGSRIWNSMLQVFNMVAFANKAGIPYRVYGFTDHFRAADSKTVTLNETGSGGTSTFDSMSYGESTNMKLVEVINSNLSKKDWLFAMGLIAGTASFASIDKRDSYYGRQRYFDFTQGILGSTPLNVALYVMPKVINAFQTENRVDKTIFMLYTDGGASDGFSTYRSVDLYGGTDRVISMNIDRAEKYYEPTIRKFYSNSDIRSPYRGNTQGVLTQRIKDLTNAKILGYNIMGKDYHHVMGLDYNLSGDYKNYDSLKKSYRTNGFWVVNNAYGYDFYSIINESNTVADASLESEIKGDISEVSTQKLAGAFKRANSKARDSRFLTKKLMEVIG